MYGMPHEMEREFAEEIIKRYPIENVRFAIAAPKHHARHWRAASPDETR